MICVGLANCILLQKINEKEGEVRVLWAWVVWVWRVCRVVWLWHKEPKSLHTKWIIYPFGLYVVSSSCLFRAKHKKHIRNG